MWKLVTGGGGFLGQHIVEQLVKRGDRVRVFCRGDYPELERWGVEVVHGDLRNRQDVLSASQGCDTIFHVAALPGICMDRKPFYETNVLGTRNVIDACLTHRIGKLIYTSSPSVTDSGLPQEGIDETTPYPAHFLAFYPETKSIAEKMVLDANGLTLGGEFPTDFSLGPTSDSADSKIADSINADPINADPKNADPKNADPKNADPKNANPKNANSKIADEKDAGDSETLDSETLLTCALRPRLIWGPGDQQLIPRILRRAQSGRLKQIGNGDNLLDITYVENAAQAHLMACDALKPGSCLAGQAYYLSQGQPVNCWDWINQILALNHLPPIRKKISFRTAWRIGAVYEWFYRLFRLKSEPPMTRFLATQLAQSYWFDISKAQNDFGYEPAVSTEEGLRRLAEEWQTRNSAKN